MSEKRFITYKCNKCLRSKDFNVDNLRAFINLCTITKNCDGRLSPIATKSLRDVLTAAPVAGLEDWTPRNTPVSSQSHTTTTLEYFDLTTSSSFALTVAVRGIATTLPNFFNLTFVTQSPSTSSFVEFDFYKTTSFDNIIGADSSTSAKVLRFTTSDTVKVFANGVLLEEGVDYSLVFTDNNGYAINFTQTRTVSTQIKVVVYQPLPVATSTPITFTKNSMITFSANETAWSNIQEIEMDNDEIWTLFTCKDISNIPANILLNVYPGNNQLTLLSSGDLSQVRFLLSYKPYLSCDRNYSLILSLDNLVDVDNNIKLTALASERRLEVSNISLTKLVLPISLKTITNIADEKITSSLGIDQKTFPQNTNIIGPF